MINRQLVDGINGVVGEVEFCKGCAYGRSKWKPHPSTSTKTRRQLERIHVDICGPLPNSLGGNRYFLLLIDEHTHHHWVEFLPKKSDAFSCLQKWKLRAERETDLKLQYLKCNKTGRWPALFLTLTLPCGSHYITLHYSTLPWGGHFITLHYSTLLWGGHFITLHYSTLLGTLFSTLLYMCALYGGRW